MGFFGGFLDGLLNDGEGNDGSVGSIVGGLLGTVLNTFIDDSTSLDAFVEHYSKSQDAAGVYLQLDHGVFSKKCTINATILDHNEKAIDKDSWDLDWDADTKKLMQGKKEIYYSF
jgi:hypothetical protein